jgi:hypothetical protein
VSGDADFDPAQYKIKPERNDDIFRKRIVPNSWRDGSLRHVLGRFSSSLNQVQEKAACRRRSTLS